MAFLEHPVHSREPGAVRPRRLRRCAAVVALNLATAAVWAGGSPDPIEGKWYGKAGFPQDRIDLGLEFRRNAKGELKAYLYEPVLNFYGLELPGVVVRNGETYTNKDYAITLRLRGDTLDGTYMPLDAPAELRRTQILPAETPIPDLPTGPGPRWTAKLGGSIYAPAAVRDGVAYLGSTTGLLYAVRISDGSFAWVFVAGRAIHGEAIATDDNLYFVCDNGYLFKLDRRTGKEVWRYDLGDERVPRPLPHQVLDKIGVGEFDFDAYAPRPVLDGGVVYVGAGDGSFHAIEAEAGKRIWRFENRSSTKAEGTPWDTLASSKNRTTAVLDHDRVIFGSFDHHVYALDRRTGKLLWTKDTRAEVTSSPVVIGGRLIIGNRGGLLAALDPATGSVVWRATLWGSSVESTPIPAAEGLFLIGSSDLRRTSLIDSKDGRVVWRTDVYGVAWARPAASEKFVYQCAFGFLPYDIRHRGGVVAMDRATGAVAWRWPSPDCDRALITGFVAAPVLADHTLLVGGLDGNLYGFAAE